MATDFWASSHFNRWTVDRATVKKARIEDLKYVDGPDQLALLGVYFANLISKLGSKLALRQRVIATATVFFRRFYLKNSYCETDPYLVLAACLYVAAKAEEHPVHIKNVVTDARSVFSEDGIKNFNADNSKLAEMEFYLVDDLECDLTVFHPYRTLMTLVKDQSKDATEREAGELGVGIEDGARYWGTGQGRLALPPNGIQFAWFIINDTYRSDICLLYPPHLIAIAALYLTCTLHPGTRAGYLEWTELQQAAATVAQPETPGPPTRRSSRHSNATAAKEQSNSQAQTPSASSDQSSLKTAAPQDFVGFFASLNVNMTLVATIVQEMLSFYALYDRLKEDAGPGTLSRTSSQSRGQAMMHAQSRSGSRHSSSTPGGSDNVDDSTRLGGLVGGFEVNSVFLMQLLARMRAQREADLAQASSGRQVAVNKMLERAQAAG